MSKAQPGGAGLVRPATASLAITAALIAANAARLWMIRDFMADDAFISLRYARNLARGWGLSFNYGEHSEGFSNLLLVLIEAIPFKLGIADPVWAPNVIGAVSSLFAILIIWRIAYEYHGDWLAALCAPVVLASSLAFSVWSLGGLETTLFLALLLAALWRYTREVEDARAFPISALLLCLATMTRPEGAWFAVALAAHTWWLAALEVVRRRQSERWVAILVAFAVSYAGWKLSYFGQVLPITWYAKGIGETSGGLVREGLVRLREFLTFDIGYAAVLLLPLAFLSRRSRRWMPLLVVMLSGYLAYVVRQGGTTVVGDVFRFYVPALAPLALLVSLGCAAVRDVSAKRPATRRLATAAIGLFLVAHYVSGFRTYVTAAVTGVTIGPVWGAEPPLRENRARLEAGHVRVGRWFHEHSAPDARIVVWDAGAIPYYSDRFALDSWTLNDMDIAVMKRTGASAAEIADFILFQSPHYYVTPTYGVVSSALFQANYRRREDAGSSGYYYPLHVFERRYPVLLENVALDTDGVLRPSTKVPEGNVSSAFVRLDAGGLFSYPDALAIVQSRAHEYLGRPLTGDEVDTLKATYGDAGPQGTYTSDGLNVVLRDLHHRGLVKPPGVGLLYSPIRPFAACADPFVEMRARPGPGLRVATQARFGPTPSLRLSRWSTWLDAGDVFKNHRLEKPLWIQCRTLIGGARLPQEN